MHAMQETAHNTAKGLAGLLAGWLVGCALTGSALLLGNILGGGTSPDWSDRGLLGGMLLAIGLLAVFLISASLAELQRVPAWLLSFLLGMATGPALTVFSLALFLWDYPTD